MADTLNSMFKKFIGEYASELSEARATENYKRPFGNLVRQNIAEKLQEVIPDLITKSRAAWELDAGRMSLGSRSLIPG